MRRFLVIFFIADLFFIVFSIYGIFHDDGPYKQTTGVIKNIISDYNYNDEMSICHVYIDYNVNGQEFKNVEYGAYNSSMKINDEVVVYYKEDNPSFIQAEGYKKVPYITLVLSIIFAIIGTLTFIKIGR